MGDGGSGFLGFLMGSFALISGWELVELFWAWNILLGVFIVDATVTLIRRLIAGEQFSKAHRTHAYQYASREHNSHANVSVVVGMINILWLFPIACSVVSGQIHGLIGVLISYTPLLLVALRFHAGVKEELVK
jgi:Fuc2NAc and GlcNAc transferase